ncbi:MAG: extracellular solute-binding protein [Lachnospiraceae bacterium]|nr:extracellular solute-binding protein [Lachnospiraceae bacterium]
MKAIRSPYLFILLLSILFCLTGCGKEKKAAYDIVPEYEALIFPEAGEYLLGAQYYKGEAVQITGNREGEVFLCKEGKAAEIFMTDVSQELILFSTRWWIASDGSTYVLSDNTLTALSADGAALYSIQADGAVTDICESTSGEIIVTIGDTTKFNSGLAVLDTETRTLGKINWLKTIIYRTGKGQTGDVLVLDGTGLYDYSLSDGEKTIYMEWANSAYTPSSVWDIKFLASNLVRLYTRDGMEVTLSKVNLDDSDRTILTLKASYLKPEMKELIVRFNQENEEYYIRVEERPDNVDYNTYLQKLQMEFAAGHGADILDISLVEAMPELLEIGAIEELSGRIEKEGINREDYFPQAFQMFGQEDGVYGMPYSLQLSSICMDSTLFPDERVYNLENLLTVLEEYPEDAVLVKTMGAWYVLSFFLEDSEDLNGLINWENNTCDFSGENFKRMLELAKRYGDTEYRNTDYLVVRTLGLDNYMLYAGYDNLMKETGRSLVGYPTADGGVHAVYMYGFCMNAASAHKDGVWEFMTFLLQEDNQYLIGTAGHNGSFPISRAAFQKAGEFYIEDDGPHGFLMLNMVEAPGLEFGADEFTKEQLADLEQLLEIGKLTPWRNQMIVDIIVEESDAYFNGDKTIEEVSVLIQNRVQLYLNELD